jgi:hypothetical protein
VGTNWLKDHAPDQLIAPQPAVDEDWLPTSANINALAAPVRRYIHDLITNADPSGMVAENTLLRDQTRQLDAMIGRLKAQPVVPEMVHILSIVNGNIWHTEASENLKLAKDFELRLYADADLLSAGKETNRG